MAKTAVKMVNGVPTAVDPDAEDVTPEQAAAMKAIKAAQSAQNKTDSDTEDMKQNPINKAKGGIIRKAKASGGAVRGAGCATKGKGKGTMY